MAIEQESLQDYLDKQQGVTQPGFVVDSDSKAEWALNKISAVRAKQEAVHKQAAEMILPYQQWEKSQSESLDKDVERLTSMLVSYSFIKKESNPKFKSLPLPHGKIGFRKQQPAWNFSDSAVEELKSAGRPDLIRTKEEPDKAAIKKCFPVTKGGHPVDMETGEILSSITVEEREDKPIVEVNN